MNLLLRRISQKVTHLFPRFILILAIFTTLIFSFTKSYAATGTNWGRATGSAAWLAREGHGSLVFNNKMWVMGGYDGGGYFDDIYSSSDGITWTPVAAGPHWSPRGYFGTAVFAGKMWVMGGDDGVGDLDDVWSSPDGINWTSETEDAVWPAREFFSVLVFDDGSGEKMWVMGGFDGVSYLNDVYSSSDGIIWVDETFDAEWSVRDAFGAVVFDGKMWVMGGFDGDAPFLNDVYSSTNGSEWTQVDASADWSARNGQGVVVADGKMWVMGGFGGSYPKDVWSSLDGSTWTEATSNSGLWLRWGGGTLLFANRIWVMGGFQFPDYFNDVWYSRLPYQPDGKIRRSSDSSYIGNDIYNTSGSSQTKSYNSSPGNTKTFYIRVQNDGATSDKIKVKSTYSGGSGYSVKYYWGLSNVTSAVVAGTWKTPTLATGDSELLTMKVTFGSSASGTRTYKITSTSYADSTKKDQVRAVVY